MEQFRFNVAHLLTLPVGAARNFEIQGERLLIDGMASTAGPVQGTVRLLRTKVGILARVELKAAVPYQCSRCAEDFIASATASFEEEFIPTIDVVTGCPVGEVAEDEALRIDANHVLDLSELARQYIALALPMQPLCRPDCAGLCERCGHNLNRGPCQCGPQEPDSPWQALKTVLERS
ncbi:MAG: DUF177 domain-containing protein [Chloroflexi bacterium]|nr:DUF177 domain-containing protein [Chloroflexota bacterium]